MELDLVKMHSVLHFLAWEVELLVLTIQMAGIGGSK